MKVGIMTDMHHAPMHQLQAILKLFYIGSFFTTNGNFKLCESYLKVYKSLVQQFIAMALGPICMTHS